MRVSVAVPLAVALVAAGCIGAVDDDPLGQAGGPGPAPTALLDATNVTTTWPGAEPVVDVGPEGTIYIEGVGTYDPETGPSRGVNKVFRSADDGASWTDVTPPGPGQEETGDGFAAVGPDGTVYAANVFGLTFQVFRSSDRGETWTPVNVPRIPALMHRHWIEPREDGQVFVTLEALPPGVAPALFGGPNLEGQVDHPNQGMWFFKSDDRGDTWSQPVHIDPQINYVGQSDMAVGDDEERIYVVRYREDQGPALDYGYEDGTYYLLASEDGGASWETRDMFPMNASIGSALTSLEIGPDGTLYFVWAQERGGRSVVHLAVSDDGGRSWRRTPLDVGSGTQAMPFAAVRDAGELGLVWYEAHVDGRPAAVDADWHVHTALLEDADTMDPTVRRVRTTPWSVHEGNICVKGPACGEGEDRSLLDYPWMTFGPDGEGHVAWASTFSDGASAFPAYAGMPIQDGP